jgi:hypothetical protein
LDAANRHFPNALLPHGLPDCFETSIKFMLKSLNHRTFAIVLESDKPGQMNDDIIRTS